MWRFCSFQKLRRQYAVSHGTWIGTKWWNNTITWWLPDICNNVIARSYNLKYYDRILQFAVAHATRRRKGAKCSPSSPPCGKTKGLHERALFWSFISEKHLLVFHGVIMVTVFCRYPGCCSHRHQSTSWISHRSILSKGLSPVWVND